VDDDFPDVVTPRRRAARGCRRVEAAHRPEQRRAVPRLVVEGFVDEGQKNGLQAAGSGLETLEA